MVVLLVEQCWWLQLFDESGTISFIGHRRSMTVMLS